jgi:large subunit ribosomal protein L15
VTMRLNTLKPAAGSKRSRVRVGRGIGSGSGKTAGRGHKGQKARSGTSRIRGFEGGQMPLQRRLPKFGFKSMISRKSDEVTLGELQAMGVEVIDLAALRAAGLIGHRIEHVKLIVSGSISRAVTLQGIKATAGARAAVEAAGGKLENVQ